MVTCSKCGREFEFSSKAGHRGTVCNTCVTDAKRIKRKQACVDYAGGKCTRCGYNKCNEALQFHHLDGDTKDFEIKYAYRKAWKSVIRELDKCVLLCANCHAEIHAEAHTPVKHSDDVRSLYLREESLILSTGSKR